MSEEEKRELTKNAYIEMSKYVKDEFAEMKDWLKENFVYSKHCITRENKIDQKFIYVFFGLIIVGAIAGIDNLIPMVLRYLGI
jgi:hypothetical protein